MRGLQRRAVRLLSQTIEGGLDRLYLWLGSSLSEYTDVAVEAMVGYMDKTVFLTANLVGDALVGKGIPVS